TGGRIGGAVVPGKEGGDGFEGISKGAAVAVNLGENLLQDCVVERGGPGCQNLRLLGTGFQPRLYPAGQVDENFLGDAIAEGEPGGSEEIVTAVQRRDAGDLEALDLFVG